MHFKVHKHNHQRVVTLCRMTVDADFFPYSFLFVMAM
jgi:hypothetical protein